MADGERVPALAQREAIISWLIDNLDSRLIDCAQRFGVSEATLDDLVLHDEDFQRQLVGGWQSQRTDTCNNPRCPLCGGQSARIGYGYLVSPMAIELRYLLPILAKEATWSHGCSVGSDGTWECNECGHHWGSV